MDDEFDSIDRAPECGGGGGDALDQPDREILWCRRNLEFAVASVALVQDLYISERAADIDRRAQFRSAARA